jgi:uncharacterized protein (DUF697 family)
MDMDKDTAHLSETIDELEINLHTSEINLSAVASALRQAEAQNIVKNNVMASMASGLIPVPLFDVISLTNIQFNMIQKLAEHYEIPADNISRSLITSLISGTLPVASVLGLGSLIKSVPGIGSLAGSGSVAIISGAIGYAVGQVFIRHFEEGGTLQDFNPGSAKKYFNEQFKAGKEVARELIHEIKQRKQDKLSAPEKSDSD